MAAESWLAAKEAHLAPRSVAIERANLKHLNPFFGKMLLCDIRGEEVARYQAARLQESAAPKTVNLEVGTVRAVLKKNRLWFAIQPDVRMLRTTDDVGRAISRDEESQLLGACQSSRSRSLYTAVVLALNTCMRYSELRLLKWGQADLVGRTLTVGASKTEAGAGRMIPLNDRAFLVLSFWASFFPGREAAHYVFPSERYGAAGDGFKKPLTYASDPTMPIGRWKEAWEAAKIRAGVQCRFHDLRHTGCTRMLEAGIPYPQLADALAARARICWAQKNYPEAIQYARQAIERKPDCEGAYWTLGQAYFASDRWQEAAAIAERAIEVSGSDYNVYFPYIYALERVGQAELALKFRHQFSRALERQLELVPEDVRARILLANCHALFKKENEAISELQIAIALRPKDANILYNAACMYGILQRKSDALALLKKAKDFGFGLLDWAARDPDLACLQGDPEFERLLEEAKREG